MARRADIDGLRAFAIVLVVVYHVWLGRVSGGVDVFLLISAYFLTASFVRKSELLRPADLAHFWLRRFSRLIPAAAVTIVAVLAFTAAFLPGSQWRTVWSQAWASLFYVQNRALAAASVDYYARTETFPSILQHFWSLSVQGQVFLLWPLLILGAVIVARALRKSVRGILIFLFGAVFLVSFAYSVFLTSVDQQVAYFSAPARLWEFALGSLAALLLPLLRLSSRAASVLRWSGVIALATCGLVLDVGAGFPGFAALWPTLAAVAIIAAGQRADAARSRVHRFLASHSLSVVGGVAYALYLVHWPVLVAYMTLTDSTEVGILGGILVIAVSAAAAFVLQRAVEIPVGRAMGSLRRNAAIIGASVLVVALPLAGWQLADRLRSDAASPESNPGAAVLMPWMAARADDDAAVIPTSTQLESEFVALDQSCGGDFEPAGLLVAATCVQTAPQVDAPTFIAVGDSHAQQWLGVFLPTLRDAGWNVVAVLKGGCSFGPDEPSDPDCADWREEARAYVETRGADVVMLMGTKAAPMAPDERVPYGLERVADAFVAAGSQVLLVRDNPRFDYDMYRCWEESNAADDCSLAVEGVLAPENPAAGLTRDGAIYALDLSEYLCPQGICPPVIGNVAVYLDDNHLSAAYAASLAPAALAALREMPGIPLG